MNRNKSWRAGTVQVVTYTKGRHDGTKVVRTLSSSAMLYGSLLAIHPGVTAATSVLWMVTHVPTGLQIVAVTEADDAIRTAELLDRTCAAQLKKQTPEEIVASLPTATKDWLKAVSASRRWVEPSQEVTGN